jgi:transcriptional regulator with XRE-family HTH domain
MDAGQAVMTLRKKKGFSQAELAKLASMTQASLSHIEAGKKIPHKSTIDKLCNALDIPIKMFYFLTISSEDLPENSRSKFSTIEKAMKDLILETF